jgi:hypothetical protein
MIGKSFESRLRSPKNKPALLYEANNYRSTQKNTTCKRSYSRDNILSSTRGLIRDWDVRR